jgi:hypothetical protein
MFIPLTKSHNETHYASKKQKKQKKQDETAPIRSRL